MKSLEIAIDRYNYSFNKLLIEDVLLDLAIALEASLFRGSANGITKILQIRAFLLVGHIYPEIHKEIQDFYEIRGKIVHHGKRLNDILKEKNIMVSSVEYVNKMKNIVAQILLEYLNACSICDLSIDNINKKLDNVFFEEYVPIPIYKKYKKKNS